MKIKRRKIYPAEQYAKDILDGKIIACKHVVRACQRYFYDKKYMKEKGLRFDTKSAERAIKFIEKFCRHSKGEWANTLFELADWQKFIIWNLFGWKNISDDTRRFRTAYLSIARKNGKTTMLSAIGLLMLIADNEEGAEIYSAAVKRDQALIAHKAATAMVRKSPELKNIIGIYRNNLHVTKTLSKFEPLGRDSDSCDGLNVHCAIIDELHAHKSRDMWDVLETGTGARRQPLQIAITTAGFDRETICWEQHEYLLKIFDDFDKPNGYIDDTYFGMIYQIDEEEKRGDKIVRKGDDWKNEKCWIKANPNLEISVKIDDLKRKAKKASEIPSAQNNFLRKHMNLWVQQSVREIDMYVWEENFSYNTQEENLYGKRCFGGLDLSSVSDLTAWVLIFPYANNPEKIDVLCRFWCPESQISNKHNRYRYLYESWNRDGFLITTPGDAIDYECVKRQIIQDASKFDLIDMGVDRLFQGYQLCMELSNLLGTRIVGSERCDRVIATGMGFLTMGPAMREFEKKLLARNINHQNNPVLRWCANNLAVKIDPAGNKKPSKIDSQGKIDGIVSLLMAIDRLMRQPIKLKSKYEKKEIISI